MAEVQVFIRLSQTQRLDQNHPPLSEAMFIGALVVLPEQMESVPLLNRTELQGEVAQALEALLSLVVLVVKELVGPVQRLELGKLVEMDS